MSLTITQRPYQTIENDYSGWNAVGNPILYKMTRKDYSFNQSNNAGGFQQLQFTGVDISSNFSADDSLYVSTSGFATVTASTFSGGNTLVSLDISYTTASSGYVNNFTTRPSYRVEVDVYDESNNLLTADPYIYSPNSTGAVTINISSVIRPQLSADNDMDLGTTDIFVDETIFTGFYIKYREVWTSSAESQTNDSANIFYAIFGANQIPAIYGGNFYEYLLISYMKKAEVTIPTASIQTGNASPVTIVAAPGSGKVILPLIIFTKLDYNSAAYATNTDFRFEINGVACTGVVSNVLDATADRWSMIVITQIESSATTLENMPLVFEVQTGNPTAGNSPLYVRCLYTIIDAQ
jgi:hypothetical protein